MSKPTKDEIDKLLDKFMEDYLNSDKYKLVMRLREIEMRRIEGQLERSFEAVARSFEAVAEAFKKEADLRIAEFEATKRAAEEPRE